MMSGSKGFAQIILIVIILLLAGGAAYYLSNQKTKQQISQSAYPDSTSPAEPSLPSTQSDENTLVSIDETWNLYTNNLFGYSIKVPKVTFDPFGMCSNGKFEAALVPVTVLDNGQAAYITIEYFYERLNTNECRKLQNSFNLVDQRASAWKTGKVDPLLVVPKNWHVVTARAENDTQLAQFIKDNYGGGCNLGEKTISPVGVYDVKVLGDGLGLDITKCPINFLLAVKYSPEFKKVATWGIGQEVVFTSEDYKTTYDTDMVNSFRFTK